MKAKTAAKLAGLTAFGYLCMGAGAMLVINHDYSKAARRKSWRE